MDDRIRQIAVVKKLKAMTAKEVAAVRRGEIRNGLAWDPATRTFRIVKESTKRCDK